jgi:hypothetical protein
MMRSSLVWMRSSLVWMRSCLAWMRSSLVWMRSSLLWMRSSLGVRASDWKCRSRNSPGFDPSILQHSGIWGAADEAVLNTVHRKKSQKIPLSILQRKFAAQLLSVFCHLSLEVWCFRSVLGTIRNRNFIASDHTFLNFFLWSDPETTSFIILNCLP